MDKNTKPNDIANDVMVQAIVNEVIEEGVKIAEDVKDDSTFIIVKEKAKKAFYKSKIIWLALALLIVTFAEQFGEVVKYFPPEYQKIATIVIGVLIIIARLFTSKQVVKSR